MADKSKIKDTLYSQWHRGVKFQFQDRYTVYTIFSEIEIDFTDNKYPLSTLEFTLKNSEIDPIEWKFHLFNLSDLSKPIKIEGYNDGKEFVPYIELLRLCGFDLEKMSKEEIEHYKPDFKNEDYVMLHSKMYFEVIFLHQWHFNVYGLSSDDYLDALESKVYSPK